jgi:hypothetical protein
MEEKRTFEGKIIRPAIYARVSSEQQVQQSTIDSQRAALKQRVQSDGLTLDGELCFIDDGFSGSTLVRPALRHCLGWWFHTVVCSFAGSFGSQIRLASVTG